MAVQGRLRTVLFMARNEKRPIKMCDLDALAERMMAYKEAHRLAPRTVAGYDDAFDKFEAWCVDVGAVSLPADQDAVAAYVAERASAVGASSIGVVMAAIADAHRTGGYPDPTKGYPRDVVKGVRRVNPPTPRRAAPLTAPLTELAAAAWPEVDAEAVLKRAVFLVSDATRRPIRQVARLARGSTVVDGSGYHLSFPAVPARGHRAAVAEAAVRLERTGGRLCPAAALDAVLALAPDAPFPFAPELVRGRDGGLAAAASSLRAKLGWAAARARIDLPLDSYAGVGLDDLQRWRYWVALHVPSLLFLRDRAFVLAGHAGAFRPSEPFTVRLEDVTFFEEGAVVLLERSKGDPFGRGQYVAIERAAVEEHCPVAAIEAWVLAAGLQEGDYLFPPVGRGAIAAGVAMTPQMGECIVQRLTGRAGLEGHFTGNSMRRGFCVSADEAGATLLAIAVKLRHRRLGTSRNYLDEHNVTGRPAVKGLGL